MKRVLSCTLIIIGFVLNAKSIDLINSGFETPEFADKGWLKISAQPDPTDGIGGWTFLGNSGIGRNGSHWVRTAPEGLQVGYVKDDSSITQTFDVDVIGTYQLVFKASNRPNFPASSLVVMLDELEFGSWSAVEINNNGNFQTFSAYLGFLPVGTYTLKFQGTKYGADSATAIDDVQINLEDAAYYWNPTPISNSWSGMVWATTSGGVPTVNWSAGGIAVFDQMQSYSVEIDADSSAEALYMDAGDVSFDGSYTISSDMIRMSSGASLSGAGERYLQVGVTPVMLDGTLHITTLADISRSLYLLAGSGTLTVDSDVAVDGALLFTGVVNGNGGLIKTGDSLLVVDNSFAGAADVREGYLALLNGASGGVKVATGAGVAFAQSADLINAVNHLSTTLAADSMVGLYITNTLVSPDLRAVDFGDALFLKLGDGALDMSNATGLSTAANGAVIAGGELLYKKLDALPALTPITVRDGGRIKFNYAQTMVINHPLFLSGNYNEIDSHGSLFMQYGEGMVDINAPITLLDDTKIKAYAAQETVNFNAPIIGTGNLVIEGDGAGATHLKILNFNTQFSYAGNTVLRNEGGSSAEFNWGADDVFPTNYVLRVGGENVNHYTRLDLKGFSQSTAGLGDGTLNYSHRSITNSSSMLSTIIMNVKSGNDFTCSPVLGGRIQLVKLGTGTQQLTGNGINRSGDIVVGAGTLRIDESSMPGAEVVEVWRGATLVFADAEGINVQNSSTTLYAGREEDTTGASARLNLPAGVNVTVDRFAVDGIFKRAGTWGASGSGAEYINDTVFVGGGVLTVLETGPLQATIILVR